MLSQGKGTHLPSVGDPAASWHGRDILTVKQFSRADLGYLFAVAHDMRVMVERVGTCDLLKDKILANLFYEPSTRTRISFELAEVRPNQHIIRESKTSANNITQLTI